MKNNFETEYAAAKKIEAKYLAAREADNGPAMDAARAERQRFIDGINARGEDYARMFQRYKEARERGNEYIDLNDVIWDNQVEGLIETFRRLGIEKFTFSSGWSDAVKTAWLFLENGCTPEGMTEINTGYKPFMASEYEKAPAWIFKVN